MKEKTTKSISRRQFARNLAITSSAISLSPIALLSAQSANSQATGAPSTGNALQAANSANLSPASHAEAETRAQAIAQQYGARFSDTQKHEIQRLCRETQPVLDQLRAYSLENSAAPALCLKPLVEREKKPSAATPSLRSNIVRPPS